MLLARGVGFGMQRVFKIWENPLSFCRMRPVEEEAAFDDIFAGYHNEFESQSDSGSDRPVDWLPSELPLEKGLRAVDSTLPKANNPTEKGSYVTSNSGNFKTKKENNSAGSSCNESAKEDVSSVNSSLSAPAVSEALRRENKALKAQLLKSYSRLEEVEGNRRKSPARSSSPRGYAQRSPARMRVDPRSMPLPPKSPSSRSSSPQHVSPIALNRFSSPSSPRDYIPVASIDLFRSSSGYAKQEEDFRKQRNSRDSPKSPRIVHARSSSPRGSKEVAIRGNNSPSRCQHCRKRDEKHSAMHENEILVKLIERDRVVSAQQLRISQLVHEIQVLGQGNARGNARAVAVADAPSGAQDQAEVQELKAKVAEQSEEIQDLRDRCQLLERLLERHNRK